MNLWLGFDGYEWDHFEFSLFYCCRQYLLGITMDWTGAAPMRNSGSAMLGILVMVAMEPGLKELES